MRENVLVAYFSLSVNVLKKKNKGLKLCLVENEKQYLHKMLITQTSMICVDVQRIAVLKLSKKI